MKNFIRYVLLWQTIYGDYIDTQMHHRDPNPTGICSDRLWARVFLVLTFSGLFLYLLSSFGAGK